MTKRPQFKAVLAWCNRIRKQDGKRSLKRLPKGTPEDALSCPLARATGHRITYGLSKATDRFVRHFDAGKYPWLVKE